MKKIDSLIVLLELRRVLMHELYIYAHDKEKYEYTLKLYDVNERNIKSLFEYLNILNTTKKINILLEFLELKRVLMHELYIYAHDKENYEYTLKLYKMTEKSIKSLLEYFRQYD